jgi:hypothetical protein
VRSLEDIERELAAMRARRQERVPGVHVLVLRSPSVPRGSSLQVERRRGERLLLVHPEDVVHLLTVLVSEPR